MKIFKDYKMRKDFFIYCLIGIVLITFYFLLQRIEILKNTFDLITSIILPFIVGIVLAFLLRAPMNFLEFIILNKLNIKQRTKHKIAVFGAILFGMLVVIIFLLLLCPQLYDSIKTLVSNFQDYYSNFNEILLSFETYLGIDFGYIYDQISANIPPLEEMTSYLMSLASTFLPNLLSTTVNFANAIIKTVVGVIICTYILLDCDGLYREFKRSIYAFFDNKKADRIIFLTSLTNRVFNNFIGGKIIDSLIIGILCYIGMSLLKMPYTLLISVIIGITNIIPFFGPFIGAIPGAFIVLVAEPSQCIWFILFILLLQQFDGNILGPYILGDSVGLPAIWVMFAILVGGGLFGLVGMIIGVPTFAVIYYLYKEKVDEKLKNKQLLLQKAEEAKKEELC